jgi:dTDP-4-dehydrorhamnose 3,5-epimerase
MNALATQQDLLSLTLEAAIRDKETVKPDGELTRTPISESVRHRTRPIVDDRGMLFEMFDPRWEGITEPLVYAYATTCRPGLAKGWAIHKEHSDRYFPMFGEGEVVLYDVRPDSPTYGKIEQVFLSEHDRTLLTIPRFVWHAMRAIGTRDFVLVNFPTIPFDHANPDKYRLPIDTPLIPYSFGDTPGW